MTNQDLNNTTTIVAPMTPMMAAAIIGIRISGTEALEALALFQPHQRGHGHDGEHGGEHGGEQHAPQQIWRPEPRKSVYALFQSRGNTVASTTVASTTVANTDGTANTNVRDDVVLTYYPAPNSYTGEDTLEVFFHGNPMVVQTAMDALLTLQLPSGKHMKPAEGGEFTKRAFLNGRITLSEAEAVDNFIHASSIPALENSYDRMHGATRKGVDVIINDVIELATMVEALIEFPDDTEGEQDFTNIAKHLQQLQQTLQNLVNIYDQTRFVQTGLSVAIVGKPNVGKSSLMNKILGYNRAIVSHHAGTTRDFIKEQILIRGVPVAFIDTAGLRGTENKIEQEGIQATYQQLKQCHIAIGMFDVSKPMDEYDRKLVNMLKKQPHILVGNKIDLATHKNTENTGHSNSITFDATITLADNASTQTQHNQSYQQVITLLEKFLQDGVQTYQKNIISSSRERDVFLRSAKLVAGVVEMVNEGGLDMVAFELHTVKTELSRITGRDYTDDILNNIFANFCIGK